MSWKIEIKPTPEKYYRKLDKKIRARIKEALLKFLEESDNPLFSESVLC
jgi:mRNA-degrading endonuclease RelE of RelBE toxin-antitoxin system